MAELKSHAPKSHAPKSHAPKNQRQNRENNTQPQNIEKTQEIENTIQDIKTKYQDCLENLTNTEIKTIYESYLQDINFKYALKMIELLNFILNTLEFDTGLFKLDFLNVFSVKDFLEYISIKNVLLEYYTKSGDPKILAIFSILFEYFGNGKYSLEWIMILIFKHIEINTEMFEKILNNVKSGLYTTVHTPKIQTKKFMSRVRSIKSKTTKFYEGFAKLSLVKLSKSITSKINNFIKKPDIIKIQQYYNYIKKEQQRLKEFNTTKTDRTFQINKFKTHTKDKTHTNAELRELAEQDFNNNENDESDNED